MVNLIFEEKNNENVKEKKEKKHRMEIFMVAAAIYVLYKISVKHENEITNLKKVIEEMKSKGE